LSRSTAGVRATCDASLVPDVQRWCLALFAGALRVPAYLALAALTSEPVVINAREPAEMQNGISNREAQFGVTTDMMTEEQRREMGQQLVDGMPAFMFFMVPAFAGIVMLVMRGSGRTYPEHLYFALHLHAVIFAIAAVVLPLNLLGRTAEAVSALSRVGFQCSTASWRCGRRTGWGGGERSGAARWC
jgi:hypothetical protein